MEDDKDKLERWSELDEPQETCPKCKSKNIPNEDGPDEWHRLPVTCLDCGYQWHEPIE
jgi:predicted Zn-ribbon and HTH transcriptional regulator